MINVVKSRKGFALIALVAAIALACSDAGPAGPSGIAFSVAAEADMYRLTGAGKQYGGSDQDLVITALKKFDGSLEGRVSDPGQGRFGDVVGIVPPSTERSYWCVAVELDAAPGFVVLWYVRDNDGTTARDEIAENGGFGATCALYPAPTFDFVPLLSGDFKGDVKTR